MELAWLQKCTPDYLKLSEVSTIRTFSSRKWQGFAFSSALCTVIYNYRSNKASPGSMLGRMPADVEMIKESTCSQMLIYNKQ